MRELARLWEPVRSEYANVTAHITVNKSVQLTKLVVNESCGNKRGDEAAVKALRALRFEPLSDTYLGQRYLRIDVREIMQIRLEDKKRRKAEKAARGK